MPITLAPLGVFENRPPTAGSVRSIRDKGAPLCALTGMVHCYISLDVGYVVDPRKEDDREPGSNFYNFSSQSPLVLPLVALDSKEWDDDDDEPVGLR